MCADASFNWRWIELSISLSALASLSNYARQSGVSRSRIQRAFSKAETGYSSPTARSKKHLPPSQGRFMTMLTFLCDAEGESKRGKKRKADANEVSLLEESGLFGMLICLGFVSVTFGRLRRGELSDLR